MKILNAAGTGNGDSYELRTGGKNAKENIRTVYVYGTFGGTTVTVQISPDGTNWFTVTGLSFTDVGAINMEARAAFIRGVVTGGTTPSITMVIF